MAETAYIVLREVPTTEDGDSALGWREIASGPWKASTPQGAIKAALAGREKAGIYAAVPVRSWHPLSLAVETQTVLRLEQPAT